MRCLRQVRFFSQRLPSLQLFQRAVTHKGTAIVSNGLSFSYKDLLQHSDTLADEIRSALKLAPGADLKEARVSFLTPATYEYAVAQWAVFRAGGVAVPLSTHHPQPELEYYVKDSGASVVVGHKSFSSLVRPVAIACGAAYVEIGDYQPKVRLTKQSCLRCFLIILCNCGVFRTRHTLKWTCPRLRSKFPFLDAQC